MFNHYATASLLAFGISLVHVHAHQQNVPEWWIKENISKGVGAITGAIVGSQIGGGRGRAAAIALGTLAGYWAGGRVGAYLTEKDRTAINQATTRAIANGQSSTWRNPDTGTLTEVTAHEAQTGLKPKVDRLPPVELLNAYYVPNTNINVRGGPGTQYEVLHSIKRGEKIPVVGKVVNRDWYLVAERGRASGFLYAPLTRLDSSQELNSNAIRIASAYPQPGRTLVARHDCRAITQKVSLNNGHSESHQFEVCQKSNGNWERI